MRRSMRNWILYMKENDLSTSQVGALYQIHRGRSNVSDLGEGLGISIAAASQMLERLVQQELIVRSEDLQDRRVKHLVLTDKGNRVVEESLQARQGWLDDFVSTLSAGEKEQIAAAVRIMIDKTNELDQRPELER
jgi:DNA-binding MarR family transcriptional regulator